MNERVLISGAGIGGLTLAYWLRRYGFQPTVVERAATLPAGGYMIDFAGAGYDIVEKMGLRASLEQHDIRIGELVFVDEQNRRLGALNFERIRELLDGRAANILRSSLAHIIYDAVANGIEIIFGNSIRGVAQDDVDVEVSFAHGPSRRFDLLVGADGLHSVVRSLAFGEESRFLKYFGYYTASFTVEDEIGRVKSFASHTAPGRQVGVYPVDANHLATFFLFVRPEPLAYDRHDVAHQMRTLRDAFAGVGWECPRLLEQMERAPDFYFDSVSQTEMDRWSQGRITLIGDACGCPSLLSGKGSTLAMAGAYVLAGELARAGGDPAVAFPRYEALLKPYVAEKQKLAGQFAGSFLPRSAFGVWARNRLTGLMNLRPFAKWFISKFMTDTLPLQEYGTTAMAPRAAQPG